jgi:hypothetical protein
LTPTVLIQINTKNTTGEEALDTFIQDIKDQYLDSSVKLAGTLYLQLTSILRVIHTTRIAHESESATNKSLEL